MHEKIVAIVQLILEVVQAHVVIEHVNQEKNVTVENSIDTMVNAHNIVK
jgi:hypothetical protein